VKIEIGVKPKKFVVEFWLALSEEPRRASSLLKY